MKSSTMLDINKYILSSLNNKYCTSFKHAAHRRAFKQTKLALF